MYNMVVASSLVFLVLCAPSLAYVDGARSESCYDHSVIHLQPFTNIPNELITCIDPCIFQVDVRLVLDMSDLNNVTVEDSLATTYECGSTYQVTIRQAGPNGFQGFLIQAREDTETFDPYSNIYGEWIEDSSLLYQPLFCGKNNMSPETTFPNSATQRTRIVNAHYATNLTVPLYWAPPQDYAGKYPPTVAFWYTIVQQQPKNYRPVKGPVLIPGPSCATPLPPTTPTIPPTTILPTTPTTQEPTTPTTQPNAEAVKCCLDATCEGTDKTYTTSTSKECCLGSGVAYVEQEGEYTTCIVVGWINGTVFRGEERDALYTLQVGYVKGGSAIRKGKLKLKLQHTSDSADNGRDYNIFPRKTISVSPTKPQSISMWLIRDGIGFEGEESFQLQLSKKSGADVFLQNNITVVIIDKDVVSLGFEQASYTYYEPQGINTIPIWIAGGALLPPNKKFRFSLLITPLSIPDEGVDAINVQNDINVKYNMDNATTDMILDFSLLHFERVKVFQFSIIEDFIAERTEAFNLRLESDEIDLATMESLTYTTVYIMDSVVCLPCGPCV